jgi:hypothetical protein
MFKKIISGFIIVIFVTVVYNSKTDFYEKSKEFSKMSFSGEITKIVVSRGTKVYFTDYGIEKYFYIEDYSGVELFVGDILRKNGEEIRIMRKDSNGEYVEVGKGKSLKPEKSYCTYFTGI